MKRLIFFFIALMLLPLTLCCEGCSAKQKTTESKDSIAADSLEDDTSGATEFGGTVSDVNQWLRVSSAELKTAALQRLADAYNSAVVMNSLLTDFDLQICMDFEYDAAVKAIKKIDPTVVKDPETLAKLQAYKQEMLYLLTVNPDSVDQQVHNPWQAKYDLGVFLSKKYGIKTFGRLDEEKATAVYSNCPGVPEWGKLIAQRGEKNLSQEIYAKYQNARDFDAQCVYGIELAHAYEADKEKWDDEGANPAVPIMESLMKAQKYSPYLFTLWKTWRVLYQNGKGFSKESEIRNDIYNDYRNLCACTIFSHIALHPDDLLAVNEFLLIAWEKNILREGEYSMGNQNAVDYYDLFPEVFSEE